MDTRTRKTTNTIDNLNRLNKMIMFLLNGLRTASFCGQFSFFLKKLSTSKNAQKNLSVALIKHIYFDFCQIWCFSWLGWCQVFLIIVKISFIKATHLQKNRKLENAICYNGCRTISSRRQNRVGVIGASGMLIENL